MHVTHNVYISLNQLDLKFDPTSCIPHFIE